MDKDTPIYVVQDRSDNVNMVTYDYDEAKKLQEELNDTKHNDSGKISTWVNNKRIDLNMGKNKYWGRKE
jgi:hypothetical protein